LLHILKPLISELKSLYGGVEMQLHPSEPTRKTLVSGVLGLISADWPATSELCGFAQSTCLSHCSKCEHHLTSIKDRHTPEFFELRDARTRAKHIRYANAFAKLSTADAQRDYLSKHGYRPCAFLELPYFCPGQDHAVDLMHSCYMGTCKDLFELFKSYHYLTDPSFATMEQRSRLITFPPTIGRICHKINAGLSQLKADQVRKHPRQDQMDTGSIQEFVCHVWCVSVVLAVEKPVHLYVTGAVAWSISDHESCATWF
jgi:hypothetical protein